MAVRNVLTWGDPRLKQNSEDVGDWTPELETLVQDLFDTSYAEEGVGIAAPQVGVNLNIAVIDTSCGQDPAARIVLINPEVLRGEGTQRGPEGCLSIPGIHEILERPRKVWVKTRTREGAWEELEGEDLLARAFCHEIDHLRGRLFVEYFGPVKRQIIQRKYSKSRA
ncbi:peptide deformylase [Mesoterricola sediminis]|uniref:Peptide deformylase n=1 Tax=Mesoterricola sediminis TaxID=2927980 RepID=A0AA48H993_9BACT|nr:peptide deformylase [Mesoterricola sediminis]BDU78268.1 peptide deformylase [Mesoterricola sediminis]